jgi:short-subunit dehydrogenase
VNVSSSVVGTRPETYGVYAATKAAVEALTAILWINGQVLRANGGMV